MIQTVKKLVIKRALILVYMTINLPISEQCIRVCIIFILCVIYLYVFVNIGLLINNNDVRYCLFFFQCIVCFFSPLKCWSAPITSASPNSPPTWSSDSSSSDARARISLPYRTTTLKTTPNEDNNSQLHYFYF